MQYKYVHYKWITDHENVYNTKLNSNSLTERYIIDDKMWLSTK